jgi:hypothetical protein
MSPSRTCSSLEDANPWAPQSSSTVEHVRHGASTPEVTAVMPASSSLIKLYHSSVFRLAGKYSCTLDVRLYVFLTIGNVSMYSDEPCTRSTASRL